jgi:hypothetical protein
MHVSCPAGYQVRRPVAIMMEGREQRMRVTRLLNLRRDLAIAIAVPLVVKAASLAANEIRSRGDGESKVADRLDQAGRFLRRAQRFI